MNARFCFAVGLLLVAFPFLLNGVVQTEVLASLAADPGPLAHLNSGPFQLFTYVAFVITGASFFVLARTFRKETA